ncbi:hypothetical protein QTO34_018168 [Cnephaeus nilssonii]|uniref:DDE-1 domain-containing protein n=1 Tax=Cnephaeus nilssonii TaxID=3371016 RepID=A0AA40LNK3_CNENI|nr:hypothetical protein QTO34_018168 [Eptesicus nilssonii]
MLRPAPSCSMPAHVDPERLGVVPGPGCSGLHTGLQVQSGLAPEDTCPRKAGRLVPATAISKGQETVMKPDTLISKCVGEYSLFGNPQASWTPAACSALHLHFPSEAPPHLVIRTTLSHFFPRILHHGERLREERWIRGSSGQILSLSLLPSLCTLQNSLSTSAEEALEMVVSVHMSDLAAKYCMMKSTISTILKHKGAIKHADVAKGVKTPLESVLKVIHLRLVGSASINLRKEVPFKVVRHGEAASSNKVATDNFMTELQEYVKAEEFVPQQVFSCNETGLFWKKNAKEYAMPARQGSAQGLTLEPLPTKEDLHHTEIIARTQVSEGQADIIAVWNVMFDPSVEKLLWEKQSPRRALLVMNKAPGQPPGLEAELVEEHSFITVRFLPPNTTPLIQAMDQQVIFIFKKLYTKALLQRDFEGFEDEPMSVVEDIVALGKSMALEMDDDDVPQHEPTTKELQAIQREQQQTSAEELFSEEEEGRENIPTLLIKRILGKWGEMQSFIEKYHPDKEIANCALNLFNSTAVFHFSKC